MHGWRDSCMWVGDDNSDRLTPQPTTVTMMAGGASVKTD